MPTQTIVKTIFSIKDKVLGEIFEDSNGFGFYHVPTETEQIGFSDADTAENAWHCFHDDFAGN